MIAVITAGGKGTRLQSISGGDIPKPMVPILGKPILQYQIENLRNYGVQKVYILLGHLGDVIKDYFKDGSSFGLLIEYIQESEPLGSGGALFYLKDKLKEDFFFLFGDLLLDIDFKRMFDYHVEHKKYVTLLSHPNSHPFDSDILCVDDSNVVKKWDSKHNDRHDYFYKNLTNAGIYVLSPAIFQLFTELRKVDFEKNIVIPLISINEVISYHSTEYVKDIGTPERYQKGLEELSNGVVSKRNLSKKQKAIFLDRDGTINKYVGFLRNIDDFSLYDDSAKAIKMINESGYLAIVISNQPVIARGEVTVGELTDIHNKMETLLGQSGAYLDGIYYCPHHPDSGYSGEIKELKIECDCRKPKTGLIMKAINDFNIDLSSSFFIGDTFQDMKTAENAGLRGYLLTRGATNKLEDKYSSPVVKRCSSLLEAVQCILNSK